MAKYTEDDRLQDRLGANKMAYEMEVEYNNTKLRRRTVDEVMVGVAEYGEELEVSLGYEKGRPVIVALNESGYRCTFVDLIQVLDWVRVNKPELMQREWVGLTDEDREECLAKNEELGWWGVVNAIEQSLKEKNGG